MAGFMKQDGKHVASINNDYRSGSPAMTQKGIEMGQSSTYSVHMRTHVTTRPDPNVVSNPEMKVNIQER